MRPNWDHNTLLLVEAPYDKDTSRGSDKIVVVPKTSARIAYLRVKYRDRKVERI